MKTVFFLPILLLAIGLFSCTDDKLDLTIPSEAPVGHEFDRDDPFVHPDQPELHDALLAHVEQQTENFDDAVRKTVTQLDGTEETVYIVGGDIELTKEQFKLYRSLDEAQTKHYRTTNRVHSGEYLIYGASSGTSGLTAAQRRGLRYAVDNYNALNLSLKLRLEFQPITWSNIFKPDIWVYHDDEATTASARAGWPTSSGRPHRFVKVFNSFNNATDQQAEHVLAHEIGHCFGLRHTDYFNRSYSCGSGGNEGSGSMGAHHIPGTPGGYDAQSIMNSCWWSSTNGEFSYYDRVALRYLFYPLI